MTEQELIRRLEAIERELQKLRSQTAKLPTRSTGGGGGGFAIVSYDEFPAIPAKPTLIWCKDQIWGCGPKDTPYEYWFPMMVYTSETGEPET